MKQNVLCFRYTKDMPYFLKEDLEVLEQAIRQTITKLKDVGGELRDAVTQSSETWHDNFPFENAQQQARLLEQRLKDLEKIRRNATVVDGPTNNDTVSMGHTVTVRIIDTGEVREYRIGSHVTFVKDTFSYASPIGALLLGTKRSQHVRGTIAGKECEFEIIDIQTRINE